MKAKKFMGILLTGAMLASSAAAVSTPMTKRQETIQQIITLAESLELPEDHPLIVECKKIYHNELQGPKLTYIGQYHVVGYDNCIRCCGKSDGVTKSGTLAEVGRTIAAGKEFEFGTKIMIDGLGTYIVEDRGPANGTIDVFCSNHKECYALTGDYDCYIVEEDN